MITDALVKAFNDLGFYLSYTENGNEIYICDEEYNYPVASLYHPFRRESAIYVYKRLKQRRRRESLDDYQETLERA